MRRPRYPNSIMNCHHNATAHLSTPEDTIKPQHCGFDQVSFYLLGPCHLETCESHHLGASLQDNNAGLRQRIRDFHTAGS